MLCLFRLGVSVFTSCSRSVLRGRSCLAICLWLHSILIGRALPLILFIPDLHDALMQIVPLPAYARECRHDSLLVQHSHALCLISALLRVQGVFGKCVFPSLFLCSLCDPSVCLFASLSLPRCGAFNFQSRHLTCARKGVWLCSSHCVDSLLHAPKVHCHSSQTIREEVTDSHKILCLGQGLAWLVSQG